MLSILVTDSHQQRHQNWSANVWLKRYRFSSSLAQSHFRFQVAVVSSYLC